MEVGVQGANVDPFTITPVVAFKTTSNCRDMDVRLTSQAIRLVQDRGPGRSAARETRMKTKAS